MLSIVWIVFVLFFFVLYTLCCQFSGIFLFCFSQDKDKQNKNNPENWQHRVHKTKTNKTKTIQRIGNTGYTRRRKTKQKQSRELTTPMLPILLIVFVLFFFVLYTLCCQFFGLFLFSLSSSCVPYVANSLDCFCFVCLCAT
jgi:flagellar basal body-associated protein FliL